MVAETVVWTTLPRGIDRDGSPRVSIHVAPRITSPDGSPLKLGECPAFSDWPARLARLEFQLQVGGAPAGRARPLAGADSGLWRRLFPKSTPVESFRFQDHARRDVHSFPVREVHRFLEEAYGQAAAAGVDPPPIDDPFGPLGHFLLIEWVASFVPDAGSFAAELARAYRENRPDGRVVREQRADPLLPLPQQAVQNALYDTYRFYRRPGSQRPELPNDYVEPSPAPPEPDFHERVSGLADHPELLRRLGLVVDLVLDLDSPELLPEAGEVRVVPFGDVPAPPPCCPWTRYERDERWFGARPRDAQRMRRGLLGLGEEHWDVVQVDVDGAALQAVGFADTLRRLRDPEQRSHATPGAAAVPALRSAGLALARVRRGEQLLEDLRDRRRKNTDIEAGVAPALDAEDLVRGYRLDVRDDAAEGGARWFSLHRRLSHHAVPARTAGEEALELQVTDEGYAKGVTASSERVDHPQPASDDLYLHETVLGWDGWSLAAARPGKRVVEHGQGDGGSNIGRYDPAIGNPPLVTRVAVQPRTLPRLRVGHRYRLRARTVDLAGNSLPFTPDDLERGEPDLVSPERPYLRFEPVPSPVVLRRHRDTEGESLEHLVIRSDVGMTAAEYADSAHVRAALDAAGAAHTYAADAQRHLAPPKASVQLAEQAGALDDAFAGDPARTTAALRTALREEGTFLDPAIVDLTTGRKSVPQGRIELVPAGTRLPARRGDGLPGGAYAFHPDPSVRLPYLPDPLAVGVSLTGYDRTGTIVLHETLRFAGEWPVLEPIRLRLSEGTVGAAFTNGVLEVTLPAGEEVHARLSSVFPPEALDQLAVWQWVPQAARTPALAEAARAGRHHMLTPFRWLTLTHAVQRPLVVPDTTRLVPARTAGATYATFRGPITAHARSTGRIDVWAEWTEDVDLATDDAPRMRALGTAVSRSAHAFGFELDPTEDEAETARPGRVSRHELGDTRYRRITYHSVATTRFRDHLPRPIGDAPELIQRVEASTADGQPVAPLTHVVPSSARPAAPDVAYVVPTFRWQREDAGAVRRHVRHGGSVRVWLRRPWFSSGDGEQLAVLLAPAVRLPHGWEYLYPPPPPPATPPAAPVRTTGGPLATLPTVAARAFDSASGIAAQGQVPALQPIVREEEIRRMRAGYVTDWGIDPVWTSAHPARPPLPGDFPRGVGSVSDLTIEELPEAARVTAVPHEVLYDVERKLWYCDVEIDTGGGYFPFVRLALARYQPHSLPGLSLSRVVRADFIQMAPDRTAELTLADGQATVTATGVTAGNRLLPATTMRVALQRRVPGVDGDLGWEVAGDEVTLDVARDGAHATWRGSLAAPAVAGYRLLVTEVETFLRTDPVQGDPRLVVDPTTDFRRERVVYADAFDLAPETERYVAQVADAADPAWPPVGDPAGHAGIDYAALPALEPAVDPQAVDGYVKLLQAMLNAAGVVPGAPLSIDGNYGADTQAAVIAFQATRALPATGLVDGATWAMLALASPFPVLEAGVGEPPMSGPPVSVLQRLLDRAGGPPLAASGTFTPETQARLAAFQQDEALPVTSKADLETWIALAALPSLEAPDGMLRVSFTYDSEDWTSGGPFVRIASREIVDGSAPPSDPVDEPVEGMAGFWYELQDSQGRVLYRRSLHMPIADTLETHGDIRSALTTESPRGRFEVYAPNLGRADVLVLFSSPPGAAHSGEPATARFQMWLGSA